MYRSSTCLLRPLQLWPLRELINLPHMQHVPNMWNDLAKAMKAWDRKNAVAHCGFCGSCFLLFTRFWTWQYDT